MRVLVFNRLLMSRPSANAILNLRTCAEMARAGAKVVFHADLGGLEPERIVGEIAGAASPNLTLRHMRWTYRAPFLDLLAPRFIGPDEGEPTVVVINEIRRYVPKIVEAARRRGHLLAYEAHNAVGRIEAASSGRTERAEIERSVLREVDVVTAPQRLTIEAIRPLLRPGVPVHHIPNGTLILDLPPAEKDLDVLYLGSLKAWKGVGLLVEAAPHLAPHAVTLVGGRETEALPLRRRAESLGCADRITFVPAVTPSEVPRWYARAKVGVVTLDAGSLEAREYTCPVKLMEMMGAGLPIVAPRLPSIQEIVGDGEEALLAAPGDPSDLAAKIRRLLEDPDLAARLGRRARARASEFTYERRARRMLEAFAGALDRTRPHPGASP